MEYRRLGKSGLQVSVLSLGSWITFGKQIGDDSAEELMKTAYDNGVNFFDNAEIYSRGESEAVMVRILKKMNWERSSWVVSSKVFFWRWRKAPQPNRSQPQTYHGRLQCQSAPPAGRVYRPLFLPSARQKHPDRRDGLGHEPPYCAGKNPVLGHF